MARSSLTHRETNRVRVHPFLIFSGLIALGCTGPGPAPPPTPAPLPQAGGAPPFLDPELPLESRVEDLLGRMTLEE
jgi:hypothetical protein